MSSAIPAAAETAKPARRKRWIPLSLKLFVAMMVLLFVGSVLWVGVPVYRQHMAIREVRQAGGTLRAKRWTELELTSRDRDSWMKPLETFERISVPFSETIDERITYLPAIRPLPKL